MISLNLHLNLCDLLMTPRLVRVKIVSYAFCTLIQNYDKMLIHTD